MSGLIGDNTARASGVIAAAGGGAILQVKSLKFTSQASESGTAPTQISGFDMSLHQQNQIANYSFKHM